ncbi:MAG TPA: ATP-dependent DNA helicase [Dermatophilaceae bacterium]|nr:ATP-dependent DNA helicase [Dermatophilaceae bacterium]
MRLSSAAIAAAIGAPPPTDEQVVVVEAPLRPLLVVAGAGSGKTETMAARVVWLVANGHVEPDQVLGLTFTRKAATELAERIGRRLRLLRHAGLWTPPAEGDGVEVLGGTPTVSTYHAYSGRLVREHAMRLGYEPDSRLLTEAAAWQYASEVVQRYAGPMDAVDKAPSTVTNAVVDLAGELAEHLRTPAEVAQLLDRVCAFVEALPAGKGAASEAAAVLSALRARRAVLPIVQDFLDLKRARDSLDFADQVAVAAALASRFPDIGAMERQRFSAVLLDEFQDTSEAQLVLLRQLFAGGFPVTAVGDPHQSIYGWRGASATTLSRFPSEFASYRVGVRDRDDPAEAVEPADGADPAAVAEPADGADPAPLGPPAEPAAVLPLSTSWRNDRSILALANRTAAPLREAARIPVQQLKARAEAGVGRVLAGRFLTSGDEAAAVAAWVRERWFAEDRPGRHTGVSAAVLCRKRSQFAAMVDALEDAGLPVEVVGLGGLLITPEVADIVALLWVLQDPTRGDHLMRLLTGPAVHLGTADLEGLSVWSRLLARRTPAGSADLSPETAERASLVETLAELPPLGWQSGAGIRLSPVARERLGWLHGVVQDLRSMTGHALAELVGEAERVLGLDIEVLARAEHTPTTARAHLDAFADVAAEFSVSADRPTLAGFLAWLDAALEEERGLDRGAIEVSDQAVQVLTVHAAKGLEWDLVAVPGLVEGSFPARPSGASSNGRGGEWACSPASDRGWLGGLGGLPYPLRRDRDGLPVWRWERCGDRASLHREVQDFLAEGGRHQVAEERRLAYVAFTRARRELLLTAPVWTDAATPRVTSPFLSELLDDVEVVAWEPMPPTHPKPANPQDATQVSVVWPADPMTARREALAAATSLVRQEMTAGGVNPRDALAEEIDVLLRERARDAGQAEVAVAMPRHLSASDLVRFARDPDGFALRLRRPMPEPPALAARRGTAFHAWVEQHYSRAAIVDVDELPGSADEDAGSNLDLRAMKRLFLASEWADRTPVDIELAVETVVDGIAVRGRLDAVFGGDGRFTVVDWKTGEPPTGDRARTQALQLAAYRLAYARLRGASLESVTAAFYYAATGETVYPELAGPDDLRALLELAG